MKKKILTLLLAASMAASLLAGCGSKDDKAKGDTDTKTEAADKSGEERRWFTEAVITPILTLRSMSMGRSIPYICRYDSP